MSEYKELARSLRHCAEYDCTTECPRFGIGEGCIRTMKHAAANAIEKLQAAEQKWISVEERLPPAYESVITANKNGDVRWNFLLNTKHNTWFNGYHITHWMPLPAPPKEVE